MYLGDLWKEKKASLVAKCSCGEVLITPKEKLSKLEDEIRTFRSIKSTEVINVETLEDKEFAREIFNELSSRGYKAKSLVYFTSRNLNSPKGEYRLKDFR